MVQQYCRRGSYVGAAFLASFFLLPAPALRAQAAGPVSVPPATAQLPDSQAVVTVVHAFHAALAAGDSSAALALFSRDAVILESGGLETVAEYRAHHLPGDIGFAQAVRSERGPVAVRLRGDVAWTWATSRTTGNYRGRAIDSAGAESMLLLREGTTWRIAQIHWSSRARRP